MPKTRRATVGIPKEKLMKSRNLSILLAVAALVIASLACAAGEPTLSNARMAKDSDGNQTTAVFGAFDTIYAVGDLSGIQAGNSVETRWYVEDVEGYEPNYLIDSSSLSFENSNYKSFYFEFPAPSGGWPSGTYKVEIYFNGTLHDTLQYSVQ